jgi:hypothetical protein
MPAAQNVLHKAIVEKAGGTGSLDVFFKTNKLLYIDNFATAVGISLAPANERGNPPTPIRLLCRAGYLFRCYVSLKPASTEAPKTVSVLVPNKNYAAFMAWANAGTNTLPGYGKQVLSGGIRMNRVTLQ